MLTAGLRLTILTVGIALATTRSAQSQSTPRGVDHRVTVRVPLIVRMVIDSPRVADGGELILRSMSNAPAWNREIAAELLAAPLAILETGQGRQGGAQDAGRVRFSTGSVRYTLTAP